MTSVLTSRTARLFATAGLVLLIQARVAAQAGPGVIGIDFTGGNGAMGATEVAGVVARSQWNPASGSGSSALLVLRDETGAPTAATVTWTAAGSALTPIYNTAGNRRMMKGYLDTTSTSSTVVTVAGLPLRAYDVYVYVDGNNGWTSRTGAYRISGAGITTASVNATDAAYRNFSGTFIQANNSTGNYVKFSITATGFTLTATPGTASTSTRRAPVNGLQIVPVGAAPPPVAYTITGTLTPSASGAGATVTLGGSATATTTANSSGQYAFGGVAPGSYAVMPSKPGYVFSPTSRNVSVTSSSLSGVDFTASATTTHAISGSITPAAAGAGATVTLGGAASAATTADASGSYSFQGLANGSYTVTPASSGYSFTPPTRAVTISGASLDGVNFSATTVAFYDDFAGTSLDTTRWAVADRRGDASNNEPQCYHPANVAVAGGFLTITARYGFNTCGGYSSNYSSGFVNWRTFNYTYGTLEIRAKLTGGTGPWPALWLVGHNCQFGEATCDWPNPGSDEIDMTEILHSNLTTVNQQIHSGSNNDGCQASTSNVSQNWHTYSLEWSPGRIVWKIDGATTCTKTFSVGPSTPMFLIMNVAVGGNGGGTIVNSTLPQTMTIDYVKLTTP